MAPRTALVIFATLLSSVVLSADRSTDTTTQASSPLLKAQQAVAGDVTVTVLALEGQRRFVFVPEDGVLTPRSETTEELLFMLPDRYRQTSISVGSAFYRGFSGERPVNGAKSLSADVRVSVGAPDADFVPRQRVVAARLLLGILGTIEGPLTLTAVPAAGGAIRVTGPHEFDAFVDLDPATGTPLRVRYIDMVRFASKGTYGSPSDSTQGGGSGAGTGGRGGIGGGPGSGRSFSFTSGPPERAEITITFADRRRVNGVMIPHRMTTTARSLATGEQEPREELSFDRVTVNPPLTVEDIEREL